jgi:tetratricopeptide (TPR) repeat protein
MTDSEQQTLAVQQALDLALQHHGAGRLSEAEGIYQQILQADPNQPVALHLLGVIAHQAGKNDMAVDLMNKALAIKPEFAEAHRNLGLALQDLGRLHEAVASYHKALAIKPDVAETHYNIGATFRDLGKLEDAIASFDTAIALKPGYAEAYTNKALALLLGGDFAGGLPLYEWRWKFGKLNKTTRPFPQPLWLGDESLRGKSILLHSEQGLGDTIQFCRYAKLASNLGARVILEVDRSLVRLLKQLSGATEIIAKGSTLPPFDFHCPLLSLPLAFKTRLETIPNPAAYLRAEAPRIDRWADKICRGGFKIGICWQGGTSGVDVGRSFPVTLFREISQIPNVRLISLHKGDGLAQLEKIPSDMAVESLGPDLDAGADAFLDTAAVMTLCDLVVTSDTAVAHLAGALGVPTWLALKQVPDWRWQLSGTESAWYPSMTIYRQRSAGDWQSIFENMAAAIQS